MSNYDGTGEKRRDGGDSGAFRGRRHPFLDRHLDWKKVEKARYGGDISGDSSDRAARPTEIPQLDLFSGPDPRQQRVDKCVAAIKQLSTNWDKWNDIRNCFIAEYQNAGPDPRDSEKALMSFIGSVNRRLGKSGEVNTERLDGEAAERAAAADNVANPELVLQIRIWHTGGLMGPIAIAFTNQK